MVNTAQALIDAATAHGAGRYFLSAGGHGAEPSQDVASPYDRFLFIDFLHHALLYDRLSVVSSRSNNHRDVDDLIYCLNDVFESDFLSLALPEWDDGDSDWNGPGAEASETAVMRYLCNLIRERTTDAFREEVFNLHIPAIYFGDHENFGRLSVVATEIGMEADLVPYALYCFRGVCYAGMSLPLSERRKVPTVYVAAPGRLSALEKILSTESLKTFSLPRRAYEDLVALLNLPRSGYDFSFLELPAGPITSVAAEVEMLPPKEAVGWMAGQRRSPEGRQIRVAWAERVAALGPGAAVQRQSTGSDRARYLAAYAGRVYGLG